MAGKWCVMVEDSTLHELTQRLGARAEARTQVDLQQVPAERQPECAPTPLAVLMLDGWQGDPVEFGRRLHWEALRGGLGRARHTLVAGDGAPWIWNLTQDRWPQATQLLDFYHASQHLWELGRALHGREEAKAASWVEQRRHRLRHGQEQHVLRQIGRLKVPAGQDGEIVRREQNCFAKQSRRMNYQSLARRGWPIGSGPVESA